MSDQSLEKIRVFNTYTRKEEAFEPLRLDRVTLYTCGPTVYDQAHIGNLRAFVFADVLKRALGYNGFNVVHVLNVTDVGHLTSDADEGEDKVEMQSHKEGRSAWDLVKYYLQGFLVDMKRLNILKPDVMPRATEHIPEQIALVKQLEEKGYTYQTSDGIYFDTIKMPTYGILAGLEKQDLKPRARVQVVEGKRNITDFALWKFSPKDQQRQMEWASPWGMGFPGWHIECSAMSMRYLGETIDIHTGGIDHISIHHTNEIAQSEAATGRKFVNYWMHSAFLIVEGRKMSKSVGNIVVLSDLIERGYDPLSLRYLMLTTGYRSTLNFTWKSLVDSDRTLGGVREKIANFPAGGKAVTQEVEEFRRYINDDLDTPRAIAQLHRILKSDYEPERKKATILEFDRVFGLNLDKDTYRQEISENDSTREEANNLLERRNVLRKEKLWKEADQIKSKIEDLGYEVQDSANSSSIVKKK